PNLTCSYSLNGGTTWTALGSVTATSARLLAADADNRVYCRAAANVSGQFATALTFRAWDQTTGTDGGPADTSTNGGTTAFSTAPDPAAATVNAVNDAPVLDASKSPSLATVAEDADAPSGAVGTRIADLADLAATPGGLDNVTDIDPGNATGIAVVA